MGGAEGSRSGRWGDIFVSEKSVTQAVHDFVVVGAGIVGLATAMELLARRPGASLVVIEKEDQVATHQTGHNSGVIHAGVYYQPGSLKARLCQAGAVRVREFADEHGIAYRNTGKLIVATDEVELERMAALYERALLNGLTVEKIDAAELRRREPAITGVGAIWVPTTGIIDYRAVCRSMAQVVEARGGTVRLGTRVVGITESFSEVRVDVAPTSAGQVPPHQAEQVYGRQLVVCGGIQADRLAAMAGLNPGFQMLPFRGEYYRLPEHRRDLVSTLIYPVPDPELPFLGVHLTLMMDGGITVGPNAVLGLSREGYPKWSVDWADLVAIAGSRGFRTLVPDLLRTGLAELWNSLYKPGYLKLITKYCPSLRLADLTSEPAGIRAQAVLDNGTMAEDFLFLTTDRMVHVCNAPSPAATSSMPIAEMIVDKVLGRS